MEDRQVDSIFDGEDTVDRSFRTSGRGERPAAEEDEAGVIV